jgi:cation:H+ antiporter
VLVAVTALAAWQLRDGLVSRIDAGILLVVFGGLVAWTIRTGRRATDDTLGTEVDRELRDHVVSFRRALLWATVGLVVLVGAARAMVWSAVEVARGLGGSDLLIGLTIVAVGTSLPELASSIVAARKGEHDLALGNVLGSNLFNTLAVVGVAGSIRPAVAGPGILTRDVLVMGVLTVGLFVVGYGFRRTGRINRVEGAVLVGVYVGYVGWLIAAAG